MKVFWCDNCGQLVFFENSQCVTCGRSLVFLPDEMEVKSFDFAAIDPKTGTNKSLGPWKICENYRTQNVCNWGLSAADENTLCRSCRLTRVIPNLETPDNVTAWFKLEGAKRRLLYTLLSLRLPFDDTDDPEEAPGLMFEFLSDAVPGNNPVMTGHADGLITINIAEADDVERERRRTLLREPYRTLLGHLRHEIGHYYWDQLVRDSDRIEGFREVFGDDRHDYDQALQTHYANPRLDWQTQFVTSYASAHPWEDWAESWAHYLHIWDVVETAGFAGLRLRPKGKAAPTVAVKVPENGVLSFDEMIDDWFPLTYVINNLNRGLGLADGYPFVLSTAAVEKLRFVHETIHGGGG